MIRTLTTAALIALLATPAVAQEASGRWHFGLGAGTDNRSKAASKSMGQEFAWATAEWENDSGFFYAGGGLEGVRSDGSDVEGELGFGFRPQVAGFDLDLNVAHKWRLDAHPGADAEAWEFTADLSRSIGPARARLQLQHSPDGAGTVKAWTWVEAQAGWDFNEAVSASAAIGRREQDGAIDYTGYNLGVSWAIHRRAALDLRWFGTDGPSNDPRYADALVAAISFGF